MTASEIIARFASPDGPPNERGVAELARIMGGIPMTTVSSWARANYIPRWRQARILELAHANGIVLSTADFPTEAERKRLGKAAA